MIGSSTSGATDRLDASTRLECRICWYLYDPEEGDAQAQIPPRTPFLNLPDYWRCPQCDSAPHAFIPVDD